MNPYVRLILEAGPLAAFFTAYRLAYIMVATGVFVAATTLALLVSWFTERKVPIMPLVGAVIVAVLGGLTLWLNDDRLIKMKPTLVNLLFAGVLFTAHLTGRNVMKILFGTALKLTDDGWRTFGLRWAWFFMLLAALNEAVWRTMTTDAWVNFKVFGILPLTFLFIASQAPLILRHQVADEEEASAR